MTGTLRADTADAPLTPEKLESIGASLPFGMARLLELGLRIGRGAVGVTLPDGRRLLLRGGEPGLEAEIVIRDFACARRLALQGDIGFAEAYLSGEWESPDIVAVLRLFAHNAEHFQNLLDGKPLAQMLQRMRHWLNRNTKSQARRNIHAHYDLGNRFYEAWLDGTMTYSSALFAPGDNDLSAAQLRKYRALADSIGLKPDHNVLEIGCGWGGFAEFAAKEIGCQVTGLTISHEQFGFARARIAKAGLADRVTIKLQDYRDETGRYDRLASIEMFEAVGEQYWPVYFRQLADLLKPGGVAGLQIITIQERLFENYRREIDFIRRYIFPGGMLPSPERLRDLAGRVGLTFQGEKIFGQDYAVTLAQWRDRFYAAWPSLVPLGFDERFKRMWEYYLSYCEAGFREGNIDVRQLVYSKPG